MQLTTLDGQAFSMLLHMAQEPILAVSEEYIVLDINQSAEKKLSLKKNLIVGTSLTHLCSNNELKKIGKANPELINLLVKKKPYRCYVLIVQVISEKDKIKPDFSEIQQFEKLKESNQNDNKDTFHYLEAIISEIPVSVYWMNRNYVYLGCSNSMAKLLHLSSRHEIVGKTYADLYDQKSAEFYKKADKSVMEQGISLSLEEPLYQPDGKKLIYLSKKVPLHDDNGNVMGMLGISTDITERKKMEYDLKQAKEAAEAADRAKTV
ncbi:hypothetical protein TUM19329_15320 [Legionella antarctica]|uniref:PAC domain-containing protein n=1 Tax=Legionella antarctica TaxID=2708020 RepID=A0A6F8T3X9_9GAMM|nr:PAS domain-containing protein [Legionella antarctica]BCA95171.1 hypothetical protein TUM19329_15320 [Legionella antarctica]